MKIEYTETEATTIPAIDSRMAAMYTRKKNMLTELELGRIRCDLTMQPMDGGFGGQTPEPYLAFVEDEDIISVPRFYGTTRWGPPHVNETVIGHTLTAGFVGDLNQIQEIAVRTTVETLQATPHGGILVLPCGYGKTVCAINIMSRIQRRTLVLVHKSFLVTQWQQRIATFLPHATVGKIQQNIVDADADIVVGMIQSFSKREYPQRIRESFGFIVIDEAYASTAPYILSSWPLTFYSVFVLNRHHMSAPIFSRALRNVPAKYILGLSATPERKDGMTPLLHHSMGPICYRIERSPEHTLVSCLLYEEGTRREIQYPNGNLALQLMLNQLAIDPIRNNIIAERIVECRQNDRHIIVLTDRCVQLDCLTDMLLAKGVAASQISKYIGSTPASERDRAAERPIILSTYSMAKEGLDIPRLDTLVLATPKGDIVQASGRVQRQHSTKKTPLIIDVIDTYSIFEKLRWKRWRHYKKEDFTCQTYTAHDERATWFL